MKNPAHLLRHLFVIAGLALASCAMADTASPQPITFKGHSVMVEDLSPDDAVELFKTLPAPTMEEMNGEFSGEMTTFPTLSKKLLGAAMSKNPFYPGIWRGKSFNQTGPNEGRGYNTSWRLFGGQIDQYPMMTRIGPSYFDGKPSFLLIYRAFDSYAGDIHMLDEVRRLPDGRYLGIGRTGDTAEDRRLPMPFLLTARIGDYREDIGTPRSGFDQGAELELLEFPASDYPAKADQ